MAYVQEFIRHVGPHVHVISVCQPTVPVLAAVSLMASNGETTPLTMTMMGGPIDARKSPTAVNNLATNKSHNWFENNVIYRVPQNFPGAGRRVYPGFMQYTGFVAMNPDRHVTSHYDYFLDLVRGDEESAESHREFYDEYNAVLDMPAEYYLDTIKKVFQEFALVNGTWVVEGQPVRPQDITRTALLTIEGELDDISGAGQTQRGARPVHRHPEGTPVPLRRRRRRPLRHLLRPALARDGVPAGARVHRRPTTRRQLPSRPLHRCAPRPPPARPRAPRTRHPHARRRGAPEHGRAVNPAADLPGSTDALVEALDAALPQTQCTRCGYPDCRAYAQAMAQDGADINRCPPGGAEGIVRLAAPDRARRQAARRRTRRGRPATPGGDRRSLVHRLHAVHQGLPGGLHRRRIQADAHRHRRACAPAATCAFRCARWTASRWSR